MPPRLSRGKRSAPPFRPGRRVRGRASGTDGTGQVRARDTDRARAVVRDRRALGQRTTLTASGPLDLHNPGGQRTRGAASGPRETKRINPGGEDAGAGAAAVVAVVAVVGPN